MYLYSLPYSPHFGRESGQGLVEYALILVLVAIVVIVMLALVGDTLTNTFERIAEAIPSA